MNPFEAQALRDHAAAKTFDRLRGDHDRSSHRIRPLVAYLERHLFEPELNYEQVRAACRVRDNNRTTLFRRELGLTPAAYIRDCRMEVACRLLRDTDLEVAWIAELVGYGGPQVFTPAFKRYAGVTPTWFRRRERPKAKAAAAEPASTATAVPDLSPTAWRRFVAGELASEEAALLLRHFLERYPDLRRRLLGELVVRLRRGAAPVQDGDSWPGPGGEDGGGLVPSLREMLSREDVERLMAEAIWEEIRGLAWNEQVDVVRHHLRFSTPAFLRLLGDRSREAGRSDRQLGLRIARLALEHAPALESVQSDDGSSPWRALAWAWIGNAKRLALDYDGAEKAFTAADRWLPTTPTTPHRWIAAEVSALRCALLRDRRQFREALALWEPAIPTLLEAGDLALASRALLVRAMVYREIGDVGKALQDLLQARHCSAQTGDAFLRYASEFNAARCFLQTGEVVAAREALAIARRFRPRLAEIERIRLGWLEGLVAEAAGDTEAAEVEIAVARRQLLAIGRPSLAAVASLDLAAIKLEKGFAAEAIALAAEAIPLFEALEMQPDASVARTILDEARQTQPLSATVVRRLRSQAHKLAAESPSLGLSELPH